MWGWLLLVVGAGYGWLVPPRGNRGRIISGSAVVGAAVGLVLGGFGTAIGAPAFPTGTDAPGTLLAMVLVGVMFTIGAWAGNLARIRASAN